MDTDRASLAREQATALLTLAARAADARAARPILGDRWAAEVLARLGLDAGSMNLGSWRAPVIAARARQLDLWTADFLAAHPEAMVLHLGCGLDSRAFRIDPPPTVSWFDVDYPEVIELRRRLYPERPSYRLVPGSLAEPGWLEEVPRDRPAFVVAEGVTPYLTEEIVRTLLNAVADRFPGGQIAFDAHGRTLVANARRRGFTVGQTGATFSWGVDGPEEVSALDPRYRPLAEVRLPGLARRFRLPRRLRIALTLTSPFRAFRAMTCLLFKF